MQTEQIMQVVVDKITVEAEGIRSYVFRRVDGTEFPSWEPGTHIDVILKPGLERQYSLCGDISDRTTWKIAVLREAEGRGGSRRIHDSVTEGTELTIRGPRNNFELVPAAEYVFIAGGVGITPILPMIHAAVAQGAQWSLTYGGRSAVTMAYRDELSSFGDRVNFWPQDEKGLIDLVATLGTPAAGKHVYLCGPAGLLDATTELCNDWPSGSVHVERFTPVARDDSENMPFEVELASSRKVLSVPSDKSVLEVIREAGIPVLSSCNEGTCGTCETEVLSGKVDHRDSLLDDDEKAANDCMMVCVSRSCGERLVINI